MRLVVQVLAVAGGVVLLASHSAGALLAALGIASLYLQALIASPDESNFNRDMAQTLAIATACPRPACLARSWRRGAGVHTPLRVCGHGEDETVRILARTLRAARWGAQARVLELGSRRGHLLSELARRAGEGQYAGVDCNTADVQLASRHYPSVCVQCVDPVAALAAYPAGSLHAVFAVEAMGGTLRGVALPVLYSAVRAALHPRGRLVLQDWFRSSQCARAHRSVQYATALVGACTRDFELLTPCQVQLIAGQHGLALVSSRALTTAVIPSCWSAWRLVHFALAFTPLLQALCWLFPPLCGATRKFPVCIATAHAVRGGGLAYYQLVFEPLPAHS